MDRAIETVKGQDSKTADGAAAGQALVHLAVAAGETIWDEEDPCDTRI